MQHPDRLTVHDGRPAGEKCAQRREVVAECGNRHGALPDREAGGETGAETGTEPLSSGGGLWGGCLGTGFVVVGQAEAEVFTVVDGFVE